MANVRLNKVAWVIALIPWADHRFMAIGTAVMDTKLMHIYVTSAILVPNLIMKAEFCCLGCCLYMDAIQVLFRIDSK